MVSVHVRSPQTVGEALALDRRHHGPPEGDRGDDVHRSRQAALVSFRDTRPLPILACRAASATSPQCVALRAESPKEGSRFGYGSEGSIHVVDRMAIPFDCVSLPQLSPP